MAEAPRRILLVDDHAVVRRGLRELLSEGLPGAVFGEAASGHEAIRLVEAAEWDLVTLDLSIPGRDGLDVLGELTRRRRGLPVLILSVHAEDQYAIRAIRAGAAGYVTKDSAPAELLRAVTTVLEGGKYVSPALAEFLATSIAAGERPAHERLSGRELQVLRMLARGLSVKEIGLELSLSEKTVSTYRTRLLEKLDLRTTAELMRYALKERLVD